MTKRSIRWLTSDLLLINDGTIELTVNRLSQEHGWKISLAEMVYDDDFPPKVAKVLDLRLHGTELEALIEMLNDTRCSHCQSRE